MRNRAKRQLTIKQFLGLGIDLDIYEGIAERIGVYYDGETTLTKEGEKHFKPILDYKIYLNLADNLGVIETREEISEEEQDKYSFYGDDIPKEIELLEELFQGMAGLLTQADYEKYFDYEGKELNENIEDGDLDEDVEALKYYAKQDIENQLFYKYEHMINEDYHKTFYDQTLNIRELLELPNNLKVTVNYIHEGPTHLEINAYKANEVVEVVRVYKTDNYDILTHEVNKITNALGLKPEVKLNEQERELRMLSRLKQDCEYFLNHGNCHAKHSLWAGDVEEHIEEMFKLYGKLKEKPEWLTEADIEDYLIRMRNCEPKYLNEDTDTVVLKQVDRLNEWDEGYIVVISAYTTMDSLDINKDNTLELQIYLDKKQLDYIGPVNGRYGGITEQSFLVKAKTKQDVKYLRALGDKFKQESIGIVELPIERLDKQDTAENAIELDDGYYNIVPMDFLYTEDYILEIEYLVVTHGLEVEVFNSMDAAIEYAEDNLDTQYVIEYNVDLDEEDIIWEDGTLHEGG